MKSVNIFFEFVDRSNGLLRAGGGGGGGGFTPDFCENTILRYELAMY